MTRQEIETNIETLKTSIGVNQAFLKLVPRGADPKTEKLVEQNREELARLRKMLETM